MIKYNNSNINDWYYVDDNIIKVYRNNAVCYYKITTSGGTSGQTPCYAVVDDISQYHETEFVDVFNKADEKWYKLNNLNQYEEYGVYGSGRTITHYEGKLTVDDGSEYIYSGSSWINVGEVSGSSIVIKSPEYIEKDSSHGGRINLNYVWKTNTKMHFKFYSTNNGGGAMIGEDGMPDTNDCRVFFASSNAYFDYGNGRINWSSNGRVNTLYEYEYGNFYIKNMVTSATRTGTTFSTNRTNTLYLGLGSTDRFRTYYIKIYEGDTLVKDFIPWTDMNGNYGLFDKVSLSVYNVVSGYGNLTGSSNVTDVEVGGGYEYPIYYPVVQDPPNNLTFSSMEEAEQYECPWVGMKATIDGDKYIFSGDSTSGYEWVENPSRLPVGYTEVEYIRQNSNYNAYINTGVYLFDSTSNSYTVTTKLTSEFHSNLGCATIISAEVPVSPYNGMGYRYKCSSTVDQLEFFGGNSNYTSSVVDNGDGTRTVTFQSTGNTSWTSSAPLSLLCSFSDTSFTTPFRYSDTTIYSSTIVKNGTTVRDFVPAKRDSDSVYGLYDLITDTFYASPNGNNFIGGNPV